MNMWYTHSILFFFFNDTATTEIYTLSLHDALPILQAGAHRVDAVQRPQESGKLGCRVIDLLLHLTIPRHEQDRKSTRLNSSHGYISYAVFCLKKKKADYRTTPTPFRNTNSHTTSYS